MLRMLRSSGLVAFAFCLLLLAGCGKKTVTVNGKLVLPPNFKLVDTDSVQLVFVPEAPKGISSVAKCSPTDLTFTTRNVKGVGTVPGKYKITVNISGYPGSKDLAARNKVFDPSNKLFTAAKSPLTYEVTDEPEQSVTIDLDKKKVTKN